MKTKPKIMSVKFFKLPIVKSFFKMFMLISYCTLICAAILFSFKSVYNSVTNSKSSLNENYTHGGYVIF